MNKHRLQFLAAVTLVLAVTTLSLYPSLNNDFTNWDDDLHVWNNPYIKDLSSNNLRIIFTSSSVWNYIPLTMLTYMIEYHYFGLDPRVYHATNLLLHLLNCLLVFYLIYLLSRDIPVAFLVSVLFGVHPLHVESVAWISQRKDVLYALFFLMSLISYYLYIINNRKLRYYTFSLLLFVLSILSKPMALTLPFVLLLFDHFYGSGLKKRQFINKIPHLAIAIFFLVITVFAQYYKGPTKPAHYYAVLHNLFIASYGLLFYVVKIIFPINLSALYPYPASSYPALSNLPLAYLISPFILIVTASFIALTKNRLLIFGSLFFLFTILPVLQVAPIGWAVAADRYTYIPSIGLFYVFGHAFAHAYRKLREKRIPYLSSLTALLACTIIVILSCLTWQQSQTWKNGITLWTNVLKHYPENVMAHNNRGSAFLLAGEADKAARDFQQALKLNPDHMFAFDNLMKLYWSTDRKSEGISLYKRSVDRNPNYTKLYTRLGLTYWQMGKADDAVLLYRILTDIEPDNVEAHQIIASIYYNRQEYKLAIKHFDKVVKLGYNVPQALMDSLEPYRQ